jgi:cell division protease FtsH
VRYSANEQEVFLGHSVAQRQNISEATAQIIDDEVRRLIEEGEKQARKILTVHIDDLHKIAKALLEYETLSGDEVRALLRGEPIVRTEDNEPPTTKAPVTGKRGSVPSSIRPDDTGGMTPAPAT